jgi:hypothetical protein
MRSLNSWTPCRNCFFPSITLIPSDFIDLRRAYTHRGYVHVRARIRARSLVGLPELIPGISLLVMRYGAVQLSTAICAPTLALIY